MLYSRPGYSLNQKDPQNLSKGGNLCTTNGTQTAPPSPPKKRKEKKKLEVNFIVTVVQTSLFAHENELFTLNNFAFNIPTTGIHTVHVHTECSVHMN